MVLSILDPEDLKQSFLQISSGLIFGEVPDSCNFIQVRRERTDTNLVLCKLIADSLKLSGAILISGK